jgi:hypothetical protein
MAFFFSVQQATAGLVYPDPPGGWSYIYNADAGQDQAGSGVDFDALDGTWSHSNGSDEWDGSAPGGEFEAGINSPGGAKIHEEASVSFLRIQDTGDPRDFGFADPGSNRKVYLGHDVSQHGAPEDALDQGLTISFRARIPTAAKSTSPLDPLHRDGQSATGPYPEAGDGYVTSDGGKGNFVIKQQTGGAFAFSLAVADDQGGGDPNGPKAGFTGLTMNEFNGNVITDQVNFGQGTGTNVLALDPTEWHEFWIVLRKDPANIGTHEALIYVDGSTEARFFKITAGSGDDYGGISYIAMGSTATPQNSALDVDFFAVHIEPVFPPGALANLPPELRDLTPARGTRNATPGEGLRFTAVTQPPNSIEPTGAKLILNDADVSGDLVASGDVRNREFSYSGLVPNQLYVGQIILSDQAGRSSTNVVSFDTFVAGEAVSVPLQDYATDVELTLTAGTYQLYLYAGSTAPQLVRLEQVTADTTVVGVFRVPNTGSLTSFEFAPLTDALGQRVPFTATDGATVFRLTQVGGANSAPSEVVAVPSTTAGPPAYFGTLFPPPGAAGVFPDTSVVATLVRGSSAIDAASIRLFVDGMDVTAQASLSQTAGGTVVEYSPPAFFAANSTPEARASFTAGGSTIETTWSFAVANVPRLTPSWATPPDSVAGQPRGFTGRIHKARNDADDALFPNNPDRAMDQLANELIDPDTGEPFFNEAEGPNADGFFVETVAINYEQTGIEVGLPGDVPFPNLDATDQNHIAMEVNTYLQLDRGGHRMAIACDDGFVVWAGPSAARATNQFGIRSPGGGSEEVTFDVLAEEEGIYAFRLLFFEGNGGADIEWYTVDPATEERVLVNAEGGIAAYQSRTGDGTDDGGPGAPLLSVRRDAGNLIVTWPKATAAFRLETTPTLVPANWAPVVGDPVDAGANFSQTISLGTDTGYFRLRSQ